MTEEQKGPTETTGKSKRRGYAGIFIPAGLFVGMGVGFIIDELVAAMFIGLGVGFLIFALVMVLARD